MSNSKIDKDTPILVIGAGSIGERHIRNLWTLGQRNIVVLRRRNLPFRDIGEATVTFCFSWDEVDKIAPKAAFVCTVTNLHLEETRQCILRGMHVLVEKPLSHTTEGISELEELAARHRCYLHVAYMMRFHPLVLQIKRYIDQKTFGNTISIQSKWAEYLPDWHPWEDYRQGYAARKELGGGVALTLSHDLDTLFFLTNKLPDRYCALPNFASNLQVDVESGMDVLLGFSDGITANVHLNFFEKVKERFLKVVFDNATIEFNFFQSTLTIRKPNAESEVIHLDNFDRNDLFLQQTRYFLQHLTQFTADEVKKQIEESKKIIEICTSYEQ